MELFSGDFVSNYNKITLLDAFFEKLSRHSLTGLERMSA